jgi:hypothetical protein
MKQILPLSLLIAACLTRAVAADVPPRVTEIAQKELPALAADPAITAAVAAQSAKATPLSAIKELDQRWQATPGIADFMKPCLESPAAQLLRDWRKKHKFLAEIIVMDNQGANVAISEKTSDYWQGDEKKFIEPFKGAAFIDQMKFDESTQTYSVQVSVPVVGADGKPIGAICFGIDIENL